MTEGIGKKQQRDEKHTPGKISFIANEKSNTYFYWILSPCFPTKRVLIQSKLVWKTFSAGASECLDWIRVTKHISFGNRRKAFSRGGGRKIHTVPFCRQRWSDSHFSTEKHWNLTGCVSQAESQSQESCWEEKHERRNLTAKIDRVGGLRWWQRAPQLFCWFTEHQNTGESAHCKQLIPLENIHSIQRRTCPTTDPWSLMTLLTANKNSSFQPWFLVFGTHIF